MPSRKGIYAQAAGDEHALAARQWADALCEATGGEVRVVLTRSDLPGRWLIRVQLVDVSDTRVLGVRLQIRQEWPTATPQTLGASLLQLLAQLDAEAAREALGEVGSASA